MADLTPRERRCRQLENNRCYRAIRRIARYMDRWGLDPVIGLFFPAAGDILSAFLTLPFLYFSVFKLQSVPLTLALIYNTLKDIVAGLIPFGIGDLFDFFNRSYLQNFRLITGFVENDKEIIQSVNRKAWLMAGLIVLLLILIIVLTYLTVYLFSSAWSWLISLF